MILEITGMLVTAIAIANTSGPRMPANLSRPKAIGAASPVAIFAGKALGATLLLVGCEAVLLPALTLFFGTPLSVPIVATVLLATTGMAALGCLFAAMVARVRALTRRA